jgi:toxin CcdB
MAQFDVYRNPNKESALVVPFLVDVQCGFLSGFTTRVVAPLAVAERVGKSAQRLNPRFRVDDNDVVMMTEHIAAVPRAALGVTVASLMPHRDEIVAALDFLFLGI